MTKLDKRGVPTLDTPQEKCSKKTNRLLFGRALHGLVWGFLTLKDAILPPMVLLTNLIETFQQLLRLAGCISVQY